MKDVVIYVVAKMVPGELHQRKAILDALLDDNWYSSAISAEATMDQWNSYLLEGLTEEEYKSGNFFLEGTFEFPLKGLVNHRDD